MVLLASIVVLEVGGEDACCGMMNMVGGVLTCYIPGLWAIVKQE